MTKNKTPSQPTQRPSSGVIVTEDKGLPPVNQAPPMPKVKPTKK